MGIYNKWAKFRVNSKYVQLRGTLVSGKKTASCTIGIANMNREEKKIKKPTICFLKRKN
jgi:hypothetical protein